MNKYELAVAHINTIPLPVPVWIEGETRGVGFVQGVAIALKRTHLTPKYPELLDGDPLYLRDTWIYEWIVMGDTGDVEEVKTDNTSVVRPHHGSPYEVYMKGKNQ